MELKDIIQKIVTQTLDAMQPTDLRIGTVNSADPLEITINPAMAPLRRKVLYLTEAVVEKKIPILRHSHACPEGRHHRRSGSRTTLSAARTVIRFRSQTAISSSTAHWQSVTACCSCGCRAAQRFVVLSRVFGEEVSV